MSKRVEDAIGVLSPRQRVEIARKRLESVLGRMRTLIALHENNAIINYSPRLASQIPESIAAHAFNLFQMTMIHHEVVLACSIWDPADAELNMQSIPTVCRLIEHPDAIAVIVDDVRHWHDADSPELVQHDGARMEGEDYERLNAYIRGLASTESATDAQASLPRTISAIRSLEASPLLTSVQNLRNKHLAHGLEQTRAERKVGVVDAMKYGDERKLLDETKVIVKDLYLWMTGTNIDPEDTVDVQRRYAEALWANCKFEIAH